MEIGSLTQHFLIIYNYYYNNLVNNKFDFTSSLIGMFHLRSVILCYN